MKAPLQRTTQDISDIQTPRVSFSGSGGDYFRLWLSNLLLTLVTLGIYTP